MFWNARKKKTAEPPAHPKIARAKKLAHYLDSAFEIPIIRKKIGIDPLLGLLPVGGDIVSGMLSFYVVWTAYELGLPNNVLAKMSVNIVVDVLLGMMPIVGDTADFFWKSNDWNIKLLEESFAIHGERPRYQPWSANNKTINVYAEPV